MLGTNTYTLKARQTEKPIIFVTKTKPFYQEINEKKVKKTRFLKISK